ncbi:FAD:protein FMN transferase [Halioxenophilus aromaticivorans]|uniref:FAD:protein FMN transferase n=1 Tax=Halioxenophilus aromaticivorans TaxID=1306992 RepID=A0AAV3TXK8_9ALTE
MRTSYLTTSVVKAKNFCTKTGPLWALFCLLLVLGCEQRREAVVISGPTMGTSYNITLVGQRSQQELERLQAGIDAILEHINQVASTYIDDSELMLFNAAPIGRPIDVSNELYELLAISAQVFALTSGAYDVTVGPVVNLWGFGPGVDFSQQRQVPETEALTQALAKVGFDSLSLGEDSHEVSKAKAISVDLSSVAKGYAVDELAEYLLAQNVVDFLVEVGGEIRVSGQNRRAEPWRIGIEMPSLTPTDPAQAVSITDAGMATSGDYRNFFVRDGIRYSHTLDPRTGRPITHNLASVTVIEASSALADALATGLSVMGETDAMEVCRRNQLACFFIIHDGEGFVEQHSPAFEVYLH